MKDKRVIYHGSPCVVPLTSRTIRTWDDLVGAKAVPCQFHGKQAECSPPRFGCVQMAGVKVARYVVEFYSEPSEEALELEMKEFRRYAPLPPDRAEAYVDGRGAEYLRLTDPEEIVARVRDCARTLLNLEGGKRTSGEILGAVAQRKGRTA